VCGFYRFARIDGRVASNPAQYVRRPKVYPTEGHGMDRGELGRFLFTAERFDRAHAALAVLLGLNGLRVSEACAANIEDLGVERGHRTLRIVGKGNKPAVIPLVPRTARTIDLAIGERSQGPILRRCDGQRLDRRTAHRWVRSIGKRAGLVAVHPHMLRAGFIMAAPASRFETSRPLLVTPTLEPPRSMTGGGKTSTATLLTWSSRLSPEAEPRRIRACPSSRGTSGRRRRWLKRDIGALRPLPVGTVRPSGVAASLTVQLLPGWSPRMSWRSRLAMDSHLGLVGDRGPVAQQRLE
jgi:hypothetical protein